MTFTNTPAKLFFCLLLSMAMPACASNNHATENCLADIERESAQLDYVIDGDTIVLSDKRKVRVLGMNTPEPHPKPQPQANEATKAAQTLLGNKQQLWLVAGVEKQDRYGRVLAHVVSHDGTNLSEHLLSKGLAAATAVQPNTRCSDHYRQLEAEARRQKLGIWAAAHPWQVIDKRLNKKLRGFRLVTSNVKSIKPRKNDYLLTLDNGLLVYVKHALAKTIDVEQLQGKRITVRGWISIKKNKASVRLHHQSNLQRRDD